MKDDRAASHSVPTTSDASVELEERVRAALKVVAAQRLASGAEYERFEATWRERWNEYGDHFVPGIYRWSLRTMFKHGLTAPQLLEAIDATMAYDKVRDHWAFFCRRCWSHIRAMHDEVVERIRDEQTEASS